MSLLRTTSNVDRGFSELLEDSTFKDLSKSTYFEETVAIWISENVDPEMVFEKETLTEWAKLQDVEDVCDVSDLEKWAKLNGYVKSDD